MKNPEIAGTISIEQEDIQALNVRQTPPFFVNAKPLTKLSAQRHYDFVKEEVEAFRGRSVPASVGIGSDIGSVADRAP